MCPLLAGVQYQCRTTKNTSPEYLIAKGSMKSKYEELRENNMAVNASKLLSLGISKFTTASDKMQQQRRKKRNSESHPTRSSQRVRSLPPPLYAPKLKPKLNRFASVVRTVFSPQQRVVV